MHRGSSFLLVDLTPELVLKTQISVLTIVKMNEITILMSDG